MTSRTCGQRMLLAGTALTVTLLLLVYLLHPDSPAVFYRAAQLPAAAQQLPVQDGQQSTAAVQQPAEQLEQPAAEQLPAQSSKEGSSDVKPTTDVGGRESETDALKRVCSMIADRGSGLEQDVKHVMRWICQQIGAKVPQQLDAKGCRKSVTYTAIGRLGNQLNLYAIVYGYSKTFGTTSYIETAMWNNIRKYFPHISLQPTSKLSGISWKNINYQQAEEHLTCKPGEESAEPRYYRITNYPDRNGIDVFHPFYADLRREFQVSDSLQRQAQEYLHHVSANRSSTTFIGFHIRRTDYQKYINTKYNSTLPDERYFAKALEYYRSRYDDALFIICSDDMKYVRKTLTKPQATQLQNTNDIVIAGNRNIGDPGRDMALLISCNHSIVTVGTYGFWGAYLAGGTVLAPEKQTHLSRGDRKAPKLEIQLAGATNWIALR